MDSRGQIPRWLLSAPILTALAAGPAAGQGRDVYPATASTSTIELYYGTRPVIRTAPKPFAPPAARVAVPQLPPLVVPAIAQTHTPIASPPVDHRTGARTTEAVAGVLDAVQSGTRSVSSAATQVLERVGDRLLANEPRRELPAAPLVPVPVPVLPPTLPIEAMTVRSSPATLPAMNDVTPLTVPAPARADAPAAPAASTTDILLTQDRLISALGIAVGVAAGLGFALVLVLFLRRPAGSQGGSRGFPLPALSGTGPLVISERGLPKVPESVSQSRPDSEPERFDPSQLQDAPRQTVEQRRPRTEEAVVQFILDQNLAVLSAIGPSRPSEPRYASDFAAPVRIA